MTGRLGMLCAVDALRRGALVAYPTEAVFGLGCDPLNARSLERVVACKRRGRRKGLILVGHSVAQVLEFAGACGETMLAPVLASWPGPTTWLLPAASHAHPLLTGGGDKVALRVSAHPIVAELCARFGRAVVSTSANVSGRPPARSAAEVRRQLGAAVDVLLNGPLGGDSAPSAIKDARSARLVRAGGSRE